MKQKSKVPEWVRMLKKIEHDARLEKLRNRR